MRRAVLIFGFEVLKDIMDASVFGSHNRKQMIFHHDDELDHGPSRSSCGRCNKLLRCVDSRIHHASANMCKFASSNSNVLVCSAER